ncbi:lysophospholipase [Polymorphobacter sp. PAMC 29334]|uniref:alpha/beta hydrolase n=1 Tax=Polymorphobacter sp. PAMC 29334 TaxID=2862331 RepID=UPI001C66ADE2|nr:alpha/beta hydrolase [Polymorphobacter sp. PAMC 29334]QYE34591.1 lysophospholipase [Polymorphobacter sp. PAMC 29334]
MTDPQKFLSRDGGRIAFRRWQPAAAARGIVIIVPGFNSHSAYYEWVAEQLNHDALLVFAIDLRGRGQSDGERFTVASFAEYVGDVDQLIALAKTQEPGLPLFLLGHSAGGVVAALYASERQDELQGLICESFAYELPAPDFALSIIKGLSHVAPHAHVLKLKNADFSRDPAAVAAMDADPLIANEAQPAETLAALVRADDQLRQSFGRIVLPLLILHGVEDKAAKPSGSQYFFDAAGATDKTLKLYPGRYHDLLNDIGRDEVIGDISNWLDLHL